MGTWEITNFGNDSAMDWVWDFSEDPTLSFLNKTILAVIEEDEYLDSDIATEALAALEVIAAAKGHPPADLPEDITEDQLGALRPKIDQKLIDTCIKVIHRIMAKQDNELFELWQEADQHEEWLNVEKDLLARLEQ